VEVLADGVPSGGAAPPAQSSGTEAKAVVWPNPARDHAALGFSLKEAAEVRLALYDVLGRQVAAVDARRLGAGPHRLALDLSALP
jgi:hypothetical protein